MSALLGGYPLPYNPNSLNWGYTVNVNSYDTIGGRVIQVLSVNINSISFEGDAGSIERLYDVFNNVYTMMIDHVDSQDPVRFEVPSRNWAFDVFITNLPNVGYDPSTVTFPYSMTLEVSEDFSSLSTEIMSVEFDHLARDIGFRPQWYGEIVDGQDSDESLAIAEDWMEQTLGGGDWQSMVGME